MGWLGPHRYVKHVLVQTIFHGNDVESSHPAYEAYLRVPDPADKGVHGERDQ
jgi:hypothetical protein